MNRLSARLATLVGLACAAISIHAADPPQAPLTIAAAANLVHVLDALDAGFTAAHPGSTLHFSTGSSGGLVAQIRHGAPFDILLAADLHYPAQVIGTGEAVAGSLETYAYGRLLLWPAPPVGERRDWVAALADPQVRRIAIANPDTAPYGTAARTLLEQAGVWNAWQPRLVVAENVAQVAHWVQSGHVDFGFIAAAQVPAIQAQSPGQTGLVFDGAPSLPQGAVLLSRAATKPLAREFLDWLRSPAAQAIFAAHGYAPAAASAATP